MNPAIISLTKDFTTRQFSELASWAHSEGRKRDPEVIAESARLEAIWKERDAAAKVKEKEVNRITKILKALLKPGMRLKMKGCKDGQGIREFIEWDENDNLVCWQLRQTRRLKNGMAPQLGYTVNIEKTNQVTTHMPDKVTRILVDGKAQPIKSFIN